jgi:AcrR family transcriptional regulator
MAVADPVSLRLETAEPSNDERPARGRPRDPLLHRAILLAAAELVTECGYEQTTVEAIAARAGVSKPTIYRRWPGGKEEVVAAAVSELHQDVAAPVQTGSLRGDLLATVEQMIAGIRLHARLAAGLTQRLRDSPELADTVRRQVITVDRLAFRAVLEAAVARGELAGLPALPDLLADLAPALVFFRALLSGEALDEGLAAAIVDGLLLPALGLTP